MWGRGALTTTAHGWWAALLHVYVGDLSLLLYLQQECGVDFDERCTLAAAAHGGCEAVVEWLVGAGCAPGRDDPLDDP